jgi:beta-N-acetylhexosaminidase
MVGFDGTEPTPLVQRLIREGLGGIVLFARNLLDARQAARLTGKLQRIALEAGHSPLLIAADQEGGRVRRLRSGMTAFPSAMALGAGGDHDGVYGLCKAVAGELLSAGVNLNLAPCADVNSDSRNPVIGTRSFGGNPHAVGAMAAAAIRGYQDGGVLACAKHFPGHGHTDLDSHLTLPVIRRDLDELRRTELVPFAAAVAAGAAAVMSAHIVVPSLTGDMPATLSHEALTGLLRGELGFKGLILTDCMEMAAARGNSAGNASKLAVAAGADLVLWSHTPELQLESIEALRAAVRSGKLRRDDVSAKLERVRETRALLPRCGCGIEPVGEPARQAGADGRGVLGAGEWARRLALAAVTAVGGGAPRLNRGGAVLVIDITGLSGSPEEPAPGQALAGELLRHGFSTVSACELPSSADGQSAPAQVFCLTHSACLKPERASALKDVLGRFPDAVVVATGLPYDLAIQGDGARGAGVCTYDPGPASMWACAQVLVGRAPAMGRLPVSLTRD